MIDKNDDLDSQAQSNYEEHCKGNCEGYPNCDYCYAEVHGIEFL